MKGINVISCFDGMGGLMIALKTLGIKVNKYYAFEIDKFAIKQTKFMFPEIIHLGNIENFDFNFFNDKGINFIGGGSPCQGFSFAGKQLNFDDPRSKLFFDFVNLLKHVKKSNTDIKFLLENVVMKKQYQRVINELIGIKPVMINSSLLSAQNRRRLYWSNVKVRKEGLFNELVTDIEQPEDKGILLKDILQKESEVDEKYYIKNPKINFKGIDINGKSRTLRTGGKKSQSDKHNYDIIKVDKKGNIKNNQDKASCFTAGANSGGNHSDMDLICVSMVGRKTNEKGVRKDNDINIKAKQRLEKAPENKTNCLTTVSKDNLITDFYILRRLTPLECMRLQNIPEWYKFEPNISDTQKYKMLGNGWENGTITHILKNYNI